MPNDFNVQTDPKKIQYYVCSYNFEKYGQDAIADLIKFDPVNQEISIYKGLGANTYTAENTPDEKFNLDSKGARKFFENLDIGGNRAVDAEFSVSEVDNQPMLNFKVSKKMQTDLLKKIYDLDIIDFNQDGHSDEYGGSIDDERNETYYIALAAQKSRPGAN